MTDRTGPRRLGVVGVGLAISLAAWTLLTAARDGGRGGRLFVLFAASTAAYLGARAMAGLGRYAVPLAIVGVGMVIIWLSPPNDLYSAAPLNGPFGYSNMSGAFFAECSCAALMLAFGRSHVLRFVGIGATLCFAAVPVFTHSRTATAALLVLLPAMWLVKQFVGTRSAVVLSAAVTMAAIALSVVLAATYVPHRKTSVDRVVDATLSERRVELAHDGWTLMVDNPLLGVGADEFAHVSPAAAKDKDSQWAHNDFLQMGAETGVAGALLLVGLFLWTFVHLRLEIVHRATTVLAAIGVAVLGINMCVDHIFKSPAVPVVAMALVGAAVGPFELSRYRRASRVPTTEVFP